MKGRATTMRMSLSRPSHSVNSGLSLPVAVAHALARAYQSLSSFFSMPSVGLVIGVLPGTKVPSGARPSAPSMQHAARASAHVTRTWRSDSSS